MYDGSGSTALACNTSSPFLTRSTGGVGENGTRLVLLSTGGRYLGIIIDETGPLIGICCFLHDESLHFDQISVVDVEALSVLHGPRKPSIYNNAPMNVYQNSRIIDDRRDLT